VERLQGLAAQLELELSTAQCLQLELYARLLRRWNRVHNLTAVDDPEQLLTHHLLDSLAIVRPLETALQRQGAAAASGRVLHFVDAGSGGGLPGIPLAIARPVWQGTLVDAVEKKCAFLRQAALELKLPNIAVRHARLEQCRLPPQDFAVSRAFSSLRDFVALTGPLLAPGALWAAMKGRAPEEEIRDLPPGPQWLATITLRVPLLDEQRHLVLLRAPDSPRTD
jgi:16S rRNA (guanine527-N7)-methyltransferase